MLFKSPKLEPQEIEVVGRIEELRGTLNYAVRQPKRWTGLLRRIAFARAIRSSNSIEGINASVDDALAAVAGESPIDADAETWQAITGYRSAMTYVLQLADDPHFLFSTDLIRGLHYVMLSYDLGKNPGKWRPGQIFVRDEEKGEILHEGAPVEMVHDLMEELAIWLNSDDVPGHPIIKAAIAHLNLAMIHPFSDGNGRMARCLQSLVLARTGVLAAELSSIEEYLGRNTREYYRVLGETGGGKWQPNRDTRGWVRFVLTAHYRQANTILRRVRETQKLWDALETEILRRELPGRTIFALADSALGLRVRNSGYKAVAEVSTNLASRDLALLVRERLLIARGEKRGRFYVATPDILHLRELTREPRILDDPFAATAHLEGASILPTGQQPLFRQ